MRILIIILLLSPTLYAQKYSYVPDSSLRQLFTGYGFMKGDSLNTQMAKQSGGGQLFLADKGITSLDGLQYFYGIGVLMIRGNKIDTLQHLPKNLTNLYCSNNGIKFIKSLPEKLRLLHFSNNSVTRFPQLPKSVQNINYIENPIPLDSLPEDFKNLRCVSLDQNCMPYNLINWNFLRAGIKDTTFEITGMKIQFSVRYDGRGGTLNESINFKRQDNFLVADSLFATSKSFNSTSNDYSNIKKSSRAFQSKFEIAQLNKILCDIYLQKMNLNFVSGDSTIKVNLANKKNGEVCDVYASHNHHYSLTYFIYTNTDTIKLYTGFTDSGGILICSPKGNGPENLKNLLDWMYMYKIATLTASNHKTIRHFYNHNNLSRIIKWAK